MYGKKVKLRLLFLSFIFLIVTLSVFLILKSLEENVVYFISPTEIKNLPEIDSTKRIRVGGMVKEETIKLNQNQVGFVITDFKNEINVTYSGRILFTFIRFYYFSKFTFLFNFLFQKK